MKVALDPPPLQVRPRNDSAAAAAAPGPPPPHQGEPGGATLDRVWQVSSWGRSRETEPLGDLELAEGCLVGRRDKLGKVIVLSEPRCPGPGRLLPTSGS